LTVSGLICMLGTFEQIDNPFNVDKEFEWLGLLASTISAILFSLALTIQERILTTRRCTVLDVLWTQGWIGMSITVIYIL